MFNPFARGWMRLLQLFGRFNELNRRMHNKLFVADGKVAVVGGRNLTDDYFGLGKKLGFRDFDLLAIGPVVAEAEGSFDHYWNSQWAYPINSLRKPASQAKRDQARAGLRRQAQRGSGQLPLCAAARPERGARLAGEVPRQGDLGPGRAGLRRSEDHGEPGASRRPGWSGTRWSRSPRQAEHEIVAENAYLMPQQKNAPGYRELRERGVTVRLLTNSLASTDVVTGQRALCEHAPAAGRGSASSSTR